MPPTRDYISLAIKCPIILGLIALLLFALIWHVLGSLQLFVRIRDVAFFNWMLDLRVQTPSADIYLNWLGFILPAVISMFSLILLSLTHFKWPKFFGLVLVIITSLTFFSFLIYPLQTEPQGGSGTNIAVLVAVLFYAFYLVVKGDHKQFVSISFFMGYIIGVSSDIGAVPYNTGIQTFGGAGILDNDVTLPISLFISFFILMIIIKMFGTDTSTIAK